MRLEKLITLWDHFLRSIIPSSLVSHIKRELVYAGWKIDVYDFFSNSIFVSLILSLIAFLASYFHFGSLTISLVIYLVFLVVVFAIIYVVLLLSADARGRYIEKLLPDVLRIIAANLRAGMTTEKAVWSAIRPEFGPLESELKMVSAETMTGEPLTSSFKKMADRIKSKATKRAINLLVEGIELGGNISSLLDEIANDMVNTQALRKEIRSNVMMYGIFIVIASIVASPALFSVSSFYVELEHKLFANTEMPDVGIMTQSPIKVSSPKISVDDVNLFSMASISVNAIFSALILAAIFYGNTRRGLRYAPIFLIIAFTVFFVSRAILSSVLGSFIG